MRIARTLIFALSLLALAAPAVIGLPHRAEAAQTFGQWIERFWPTARAAGIKRETYDLAFKGMTPDPKVIEAANFQPEYKKPIGEYVDRVVSDKRVTGGKQKLEENKALLDILEKRYGVDRTIIVAIWGVELNYGTQPGDMNVIRSLATLAYYNTKASFARQQLITALKILQRGDISVEAMNGSWAGAMGHTQFIPTTYQAYAVDYDGDGKRNIWNDVPDALASTASYLKHSNWQAGQTWGYEVTLPKGLNPKKYSERTLKSVGEWQKLGIRRVNGEAFPRPATRPAFSLQPGLPDRRFSCSTISARSSATTTPRPTPWGSDILPTGSKAMGPSCILGRPTRTISRSISASSCKSCWWPRAFWSAIPTASSARQRSRR